MEWRDIPGYEGIYSVNDVGDIYSHYANKILKPSISNVVYTDGPLAQAAEQGTHNT